MCFSWEQKISPQLEMIRYWFVGKVVLLIRKFGFWEINYNLVLFKNSIYDYYDITLDMTYILLFYIIQKQTTVDIICFLISSSPSSAPYPGRRLALLGGFSLASSNISSLLIGPRLLGLYQ